jgi:hypothetical protein
VFAGVYTVFSVFQRIRFFGGIGVGRRGSYMARYRKFTTFDADFKLP